VISDDAKPCNPAFTARDLEVQLALRRAFAPQKELVAEESEWGILD
jgi:hypothetical protein